MNVSAVIPAYNERRNVIELTEQLNKTLSELCDNFEICYVYQGTDGGAESLREMQTDYENLRVLDYEEPLGVGKAYQIGFNAIPEETTHVLTMDADLNHLPRELSRFIEVENKADIVIGSRFIDQGNFDELESWRKLASPFAAKVISTLFGVDVRDVSSGYRLYDAEVIRDIRGDLAFDNFEFYPEILVRATRKGYTLTEVPITYRERKHGHSKMNELQTTLGYGKLLMSLTLPTPTPQTSPE